MTPEQTKGLDFILNLEKIKSDVNENVSLEITDRNNKIAVNKEIIREDSDNYGQIIELIQSLRELQNDKN